MREVGTSRFRTWNGRDSFEFVEGVRLHAIGGEQVLLCRVRYEPGKEVPWHAHPDTEQVMVILDGEVEMTIEDETQMLRSLDHPRACDRNILERAHGDERGVLGRTCRNRRGEPDREAAGHANASASNCRVSMRAFAMSCHGSGSPSSVNCRRSHKTRRLSASSSTFLFT